MSESDIDAAVSAFGAAAKSKLSSAIVAGEPEDQLRAPFEQLLARLSFLSGLSNEDLVAVGESALSDLKTRPDYAVAVREVLVGFVELKAPGKGADPRKFADTHDKEQWRKLRSLPNLLYSDGNEFSLWRDGELVHPIVHLDGDIRTAGAELSAPHTLLHLFQDFIGWEPVPPRSARQLAETSARLCRLLRDEVVEQIEQGNPALTDLAEGWRKLLFPNADDLEFADGYAQAVTFGLLIARAREISFEKGLDHVARSLGRKDSLIGAAMHLFTDEAMDLAALNTSLKTLTRVLGVVDWSRLANREANRSEKADTAEAWLYFYEDFLEVYDNELRKQTGSYYTPHQVVREMVRLVDDVLVSPSRFGCALGLASPSVTIADPAMGAGTFLLGILRRIAETVEKDQGAGAVLDAVRAAIDRVIGFELQFGPFAVAQLRILAELVDLTAGEESGISVSGTDIRLFLTDTLADPFVEKEAWTHAMLRPLAESRQRANEIKRREPITVVIGNPPYKEKAKGMGGWVENGGPQRQAPLERWMPPTSWNVSPHVKHLRNLYIYFWRWATWKVFGSGRITTKAQAEAAGAHEGVICFITVAGFLNGPGFQKMRDDLRRTTNEIWVIDTSPEGHQPPVNSRIFQAVQQPVCIVIASRTEETDEARPSRVRYTALPEGPRDTKFEALQSLSLEDAERWDECPDEWRAPFLPAATGAWAAYPSISDLFNYNGSGVMPGRTWIIAPDVKTLRARWDRLISEREPEKKAELFHPHLRGGKPGDRHVNKEETTGGLPGHESRSTAVAVDMRKVVQPTRYGYRSFDRQYIIPDKRLINQVNPRLWDWHSDSQIYLTAPTDRSPTSGPALSFCSLIPDLHHYNGRGGRVFPLWSDAGASVPNVNPNLLHVLSDRYSERVRPDDFMAYLAAVGAHPGFVDRFESHLVRPGLRIPITDDYPVFRKASEIGRRIVWLHTFGERFVDDSEGRPAGPPRVEKDARPMIPSGGAIPSDADDIDYNDKEQRLCIGSGRVENVISNVWNYEVSGKQVLAQWFSYRRADRSRPLIGTRRPPSTLNELQPDGWLPEYTSELLNVLNVITLLVRLEPTQADLLNRICLGPTIDAETLRAAGAFDSPSTSSGRTSKSGQLDLLG